MGARAAEAEGCAGTSGRRAGSGAAEAEPFAGFLGPAAGRETLWLVAVTTFGLIGADTLALEARAGVGVGRVRLVGRGGALARGADEPTTVFVD